jgi:hypothetical protein
VSTFNISLVADGRELIATDLKVNCLIQENLLFGLLTDNPSAYLPLNDIRTATGIVRAAQMESSDLPDRAQGLGALDAIVVSGVDTGTLSIEQRQALRLWLAEGGKLFVVGGPKWQATVSGLDEFLPIDLNATRTVSSLSELEDYTGSSISLDGEAVLAVGQPRAEAEVILEEDGFPLIVQNAIGFGKVIYFAADPGLQPLSNWAGMRDVYGKLMDASSIKPAWLNNQWDEFSANQALSTLNELGIPSTLFICCWLVLYVAMIGPLNYIVLNRIKRRELAWLTIPGLVVVFSCLAYFSGFAYRGARPILNRLAVVQAWDKLDQARVNALVGLYSPNRTKYTIDSGAQFMLYPFRGSNVSLQSENSWFALQQGLNMFVPNVLVEIGGLEAVSAQGYLPALTFTHDLVVNITDQNPTLEGTITNASPYTLMDAMLVTSGEWKRLGDMAPGSTQNANLTLLSGPSGPDFYVMDTVSILGVNYFGGQVSPEDQRRVALMDAAVGTAYNTKEANWGIYLMGWVDGPLIPIGLKDKNFESIDTLLYIMMLSPKSNIESGLVRLTPSMFVWETSSPGNTPFSSRGIPVGGYILRFRPAIPIPFRSVNSLRLDINSITPPGEVFVSLWDFEQGAWIQVEGIHWGGYEISDPGRYVDKDGEIRLKVDGNQSNYTEIQSSHFTLVVEQ